MEKGKQEKEKLIKELERERAERERLEREKNEKENLEREKLERERIEKERKERENLEKEELKQELLKQKKEKEKLKQELEMQKTEKKKLEKVMEKDKKEKEEQIENEKLNDIKNKDELKKRESEAILLVNKFDKTKKCINEYHKDVLKQENYIQNFKTFLNEINLDITEINNKLNISVCNFINIPENMPNINDKTNLFKEFETFSNKVYNFSSIIEDINSNIIKQIENKYNVIQQNLDELVTVGKLKEKIGISSINKIYEINNNIINEKLNELESMIEELKKNKNKYENIRKEIEKDIQNIQNKVMEFNQKIENVRSTIVKSARGTNVFGTNYDKAYLKNSMLLKIPYFGESADIFNSKLIFKDDNIDYQKQDLLRKDWKEICYIYEEYDLHDINYELKAVGLPENTYYNMCSIGFTYDRKIEIIEFEIDGKRAKYKYKDYSLEFDIHLQNLESNKIHLKYKESHLKLTPGEKKERKFYRSDYYGVSKNIKGQMAIFTLILKCDFEIINFEDEFFVKIGEGQYKWGGEVPPEGKRTVIKMSKKMAKFYFNKIQRIESIDKKPLKKSTCTTPICFEGGNNEIKKLKYYSHQTDKIEIKDKKEYEVKYINIKEYFGEFIIEGELINRCKGEWFCDISDERIEAEIPNDYKYNKKQFKEIADKIIKDYDKEHEKDLIKVNDVVKIGKWVNKNIKYDISYHSKNDISATETYNNRVGVCHHFTKLYNALIYSLGYQCIYISGYAIKKNDSFDQDDGHAWSLIKINGKWLPFDATWGIFSGKLPVCHVFDAFFSKSTHTSSIDNIKIIKGKVKGVFIG